MGPCFGIHHKYVPVGKQIILADRNPFHRFLRIDGSEQQQSSYSSDKPVILGFHENLTFQPFVDAMG